jgi:hypothetical protein
LSPVISKVVPAGTEIPFKIIVLQFFLLLIAVAASVKVQEEARCLTFVRCELAGAAVAKDTRMLAKKPKAKPRNIFEKKSITEGHSKLWIFCNGNSYFLDFADSNI